jgi:hypothetical protein
MGRSAGWFSYLDAGREPFSLAPGTWLVVRSRQHRSPNPHPPDRLRPAVLGSRAGDAFRFDENIRMTNTQLIALAASVVKTRKTQDSLCGDVGSAVLSQDGRVYLGVCADLGSSGFCAESPWMAERPSALLPSIADSSPIRYPRQTRG